MDNLIVKFHNRMDTSKRSVATDFLQGISYNFVFYTSYLSFFTDVNIQYWFRRRAPFFSEYGVHFLVLNHRINTVPWFP